MEANTLDIEISLNPEKDYINIPKCVYQKNKQLITEGMYKGYEVRVQAWIS